VVIGGMLVLAVLPRLLQPPLLVLSRRAAERAAARAGPQPDAAEGLTGG
jgi:hypothetical protein